MARTGIRASAVIIQNNKVLLVHRKKEGEEYWVFPGGGIEEGESPEETVIREVKEETGLKASNPKLVFKSETYKGGNIHPFYFVEVEKGKPVLGGPEASKHNKRDWYHPEWVSISKISNINLVPEQAKNKLLKLIA